MLAAEFTLRSILFIPYLSQWIYSYYPHYEDGKFEA